MYHVPHTTHQIQYTTYHIPVKHTRTYPQHTNMDIHTYLYTHAHASTIANIAMSMISPFAPLYTLRHTQQLPAL